VPYRLIKPDPPRQYPDLAATLAEELRLQQPDGPPDAPLIIEEQMRFTDRIHVTVIWDLWAKIAFEDRSRIILDAYERVRGASAILTLSAALGLTHADAKKLGVENGVLSAA